MKWVVLLLPETRAENALVSRVIERTVDEIGEPTDMRQQEPHCQPQTMWSGKRWQDALYLITAVGACQIHNQT